MSSRPGTRIGDAIQSLSCNRVDHLGLTADRTGAATVHPTLSATFTCAATEGAFGSATNLTIAPGSTDAYATVSGTDGGFIHTFGALSEGIPQSNGR